MEEKDTKSHQQLNEMAVKLTSKFIGNGWAAALTLLVQDCCECDYISEFVLIPKEIIYVGIIFFSDNYQPPQQH